MATFLVLNYNMKKILKGGIELKLKNSNIIVEIDETNGATSSIRYPDDTTNMNWILKKPYWGHIPDFVTVKTEHSINCFTAVYEHPKKLSRVIVEKTVTDTDYFEKYIIKNIGVSEYYLTKDNFGILMPTNCNYARSNNLMNKCVSHLWCGGNVCWMYSARTNGKMPYLVMNLIEGSVDDYSIDYDYSLTNLGADWRGAYLIHPKESIIKPNESMNLTFRYRFTDTPPETAELDFDGAMRFTAEKYSLYINESIKLTLEYNGNLDNAVIEYGDTFFPYSVKDGKIECEISFDSIGEREIKAKVDGKETILRINVIESIEIILEKRANFIAEKQQYLCKGSHLDGAYLIYDSETDKQYCGRVDHNAGRERMGMGVTVCRALQVKYSEKLMNSLKKHREFVERELFDSQTFTVYNDINHDNTWPRIYNCPWFAVYYLEWYNLTGEKQCIINAANILLKYYDSGGIIQDSQNIEAVRILECLKKEGLDELYSKLYSYFIKHADSIITRSGISESKEVTWVNELPNDMCCYLSQAYIVTGDKKYLKEAEINYKRSRAFYAYQPDFHLNCVTVRYWDNYWFGKIRSYGDVFPHYWSALSGWSLYWYDKARGVDEHKKEIENNLTGNLCIYKPDGMANNCYLYPYRIDLYSSDPMYKNQFMKTGTTYGKRYDPWANDQDWALYLASLFLEI